VLHVWPTQPVDRHRGLSVTQVKVWFQNRRMKFKRQSRGHTSHDARSNVEDSSPQRSADDDDDDDADDDEYVGPAHGTSTVTSRSGSPAVDSTTTDYCTADYCTASASGDARTPTEQRSNEPASLLGYQQTSLDSDETPPVVQCSDKGLNLFSLDAVSGGVDQPGTVLSADDTTAVQTSALAPADAVNVATRPSETQSNLARLEIMTCIAGGGDVNLCRPPSIAGSLQSVPRPRRGQAASRSSRPAGGRCDGRRARPASSRTRSIVLMPPGYAGNAAYDFDVSAVSEYRRGSVYHSSLGCL